MKIEPTTNDAMMPYSSISFKHSIIKKCEIKMDLEKTYSGDGIVGQITEIGNQSFLCHIDERI